MFNGEVFDRPNYKTGRSFMDIWPPERLRILANSTKWGAGQQWVNMGTGGDDEYYAYVQNRAMCGNYMAADVLHEATPEDSLLKAGLLDQGVHVYPFWNSDQVLELNIPKGANVVAAVYAHKDRAFVVLTNYEHKEYAVTMSLRKDALFPTGKSSGVILIPS